MTIVDIDKDFENNEDRMVEGVGGRGRDEGDCEGDTVYCTFSQVRRGEIS